MPVGAGNGDAAMSVPALGLGSPWPGRRLGLGFRYRTAAMCFPGRSYCAAGADCAWRPRWRGLGRAGGPRAARLRRRGQIAPLRRAVAAVAAIGRGWFTGPPPRDFRPLRLIPCRSYVAGSCCQRSGNGGNPGVLLLAVASANRAAPAAGIPHK